MVTGLTVLNVIRDEALQENAVTTGAILLEGFKKLQDSYECIGDVRGKGLFIGVEFVKDRITKEPDAILADYIVESMKNQGILLSTDGPYHNVLKIKPPMVITEDNCMKIVETIESILK
ncbi:MAG TPA: aminotransferase class III-fold pyridoxal phosphate-dependent enzyme, partial [Saprospiraceae bacterium]|nr:aminotransferase class III-fold pyridoxal phosphate-dependent enzyme [Saprospiraceae bacterium]